MPLVVNDFKWKQTESTITIQVPLHGIHRSKVDVFTSIQYIKASYPPNFFEVLLFQPINLQESTCVITDNEIIFELLKTEIHLWPALELDVTKKEKMQLKTKLIDEEHQRFQKECQEKRERKSELKKVGVREQIKLDTKQRETIDKIKLNEKNKALADLNEWGDDNTIIAKQVKVKKLAESKFIKASTIESKEKKKTIPTVRSQVFLEVTFTPRELPTPSRESRLEEENEWLRKQTEARRSAGFVSEDLRPEEKNPMYLKCKGDKFMEQKNYLGAISAYSFGINLSKKYADLYKNRSEAHYAIGKLNVLV